MPKRKGYLIEQIADMKNLEAADKEAQAGKVKKNRYIRRHNLHAKEDLEALQKMILTLDFPDASYHDMILQNDQGKQRKIAINIGVNTNSVRQITILNVNENIFYHIKSPACSIKSSKFFRNCSASTKVGNERKDTRLFVQFIPIKPASSFILYFCSSYK